MFNFQLIERNVFNQSYKYFVCMVLILSGVYISVNGYNAEFIIRKTDSFFLLKEIMKIFLICYMVKLFEQSRMAFVFASFSLVYTGICAGAYLMFVLNNMSVYKLALSVIPSMVKLTGVISLYCDMFLFERFVNNKKIWFSGTIYFLGDIVFALLI